MDFRRPTSRRSASPWRRSIAFSHRSLPTPPWPPCLGAGKELGFLVGKALLCLLFVLFVGFGWLVSWFVRLFFAAAQASFWLLSWSKEIMNFPVESVESSDQWSTDRSRCGAFWGRHEEDFWGSPLEEAFLYAKQLAGTGDFYWAPWLLGILNALFSVKLLSLKSPSSGFGLRAAMGNCFEGCSQPLAAWPLGRPSEAPTGTRRQCCFNAPTACWGCHVWSLSPGQRLSRSTTGVRQLYWKNRLHAGEVVSICFDPFCFLSLWACKSLWSVLISCFYLGFRRSSKDLWFFEPMNWFLQFCWHFLPSNCWGDPASLQDWIWDQRVDAGLAWISYPREGH